MFISVIFTMDLHSLQTLKLFNIKFCRKFINYNQNCSVFSVFKQSHKHFYCMNYNIQLADLDHSETIWNSEVMWDFSAVLYHCRSLTSTNFELLLDYQCPLMKCEYHRVNRQKIFHHHLKSLLFELPSKNEFFNFSWV